MTSKMKESTVKISTTAEAFVSALKLSLKPPAKITIPILQGVLVGGGKMVSTNLDLTSIVPFESTGDGSVVLPYKAALNVLTGEKGPLTIEGLENNYVKLTLPECEYKLAGFALANFPQIIPLPKKSSLTIDGDAFDTLIERTFFAISSEESRYTLNGALLKASNGKVTMVGTDGHRLSVATADSDQAKMPDTLIRRDALDYIRTRIGESVTISEDEYSHYIQTNGITLIARKLTGNFPNYEAVMPRDGKIHATIASPATLSPILKRVAKCADERSGAVKFTFNGSLEMSASSTETGEAFALYECKADGGPLTIGLNSKFVLEYLKVAGDEPVAVELKDEQSAVKFSIDNWEHVVIPMRI